MVEGVVEVAVPVYDVLQLPFNIITIALQIGFLIAVVVVNNLIYRVGLVSIQYALFIHIVEYQVECRQDAIVAECGVAEAVTLKSQFEAKLVAAAAYIKRLLLARAVEADAVAQGNAAVAHSESQCALVAF